MGRIPAGVERLQAFWVVGLVALLLAGGSGTASAHRVVVLASGTGVLFLNTVYVWPKLVAAAFGLSAAAAVLDRRRQWLVLPALTLGLLAHGGTVFALPALTVLAWSERGRWNHRIVVGAIAASAALYLPWLGYQRVVDPPGDRLLRWHLAADLRAEGHDVVSAVVDSYSAPLSTIVGNKVRNVRLVVATPSR